MWELGVMSHYYFVLPKDGGSQEISPAEIVSWFSEDLLFLPHNIQYTCSQFIAPMNFLISKWLNLTLVFHYRMLWWGKETKFHPPCQVWAPVSPSHPHLHPTPLNSKWPVSQIALHCRTLLISPCTSGETEEEGD